MNSFEKGQEILWRPGEDLGGPFYGVIDDVRIWPTDGKITYAVTVTFGGVPEGELQNAEEAECDSGLREVKDAE